jgi:hypothetical protein
MPTIKEDIITFSEMIVKGFSADKLKLDYTLSSFKFQLQENHLTVFSLTCAPAGQTAEHLFVLDLFACLPVYLPEEGRQVSFSIKGKRKLFQYNNQ